MKCKLLFYRFLIEHGADIAAVNNEGELPLDLSEEDEMEEYLQNQLRKASMSPSTCNINYMDKLSYFLRGWG